MSEQRTGSSYDFHTSALSVEMLHEGPDLHHLSSPKHELSQQLQQQPTGRAHDIMQANAKGWGPFYTGSVIDSTLHDIVQISTQ